MDSSPETPYELLVKRNIEANRQMLRNLGLIDTPVMFKNEFRKPRKQSRPRQIKYYKPVEELEPRLPVRRTRRSSSLLDPSNFELDGYSSAKNDEENTPPNKRRKVVRENVFGEIEGVNVGDWWMTRLECSAAGVHRPTVAGISGRVGEGCYSIALSGGYEDDLDCGEYFTYTGCGGRDLKGTKANPKNLRTAPQSRDQTLEGMNAALALNIENKKPVRVIRGYKLDSPYAPDEGYRYDGLYTVEKNWYATGASGFKVCKFALKRVPDQDIPPWENWPTTLSTEASERVPTEESAIPSTHEASLPSTIPDSKEEEEAPCRGSPTPMENTHKDSQSGHNDAVLKQIKHEDLDSSNQSCTTPVTNRQRSSLKLSPKDYGDENTNVRMTPPKSSEKKVRFSSNIYITDEEGCDSVQSIEHCFSDGERDKKKQLSILNYFSPVKKPIVNQPYKCTVNPKSLRGNRFSCFPQITVVTSKSDEICVSPNKKSSPSQYRKCMSVYRKVVENTSDIGGSPSMMENLIKQNKEKLKLHNNRSRKAKTMSNTVSVKPCFVLLFDLYDSFQGWDDEPNTFRGFSGKDISTAQRKLSLHKTAYSSIRDSLQTLDPDDEEGFRGWD